MQWAWFIITNRPRNQMNMASICGIHIHWVYSSRNNTQLVSENCNFSRVDAPKTSSRIWTYHSIFWLDMRGPWFLQDNCDLMSGHISNPKVPDERYEHCLSNDALWFIVGQVFGHNYLSKWGRFWYFSQIANFVFELRKWFLKTFFQNALIQRQIGTETWNQLPMATNIPNIQKIKQFKSQLK